jgi:hypothetical protein
VAEVISRIAIGPQQAKKIACGKWDTPTRSKEGVGFRRALLLPNRRPKPSTNTGPSQKPNTCAALGGACRATSWARHSPVVARESVARIKTPHRVTPARPCRGGRARVPELRAKSEAYADDQHLRISRRRRHGRRSVPNGRSPGSGRRGSADRGGRPPRRMRGRGWIRQRRRGQPLPPTNVCACRPRQGAKQNGTQ